MKTGLDVFIEQKGGRWRGPRLGLILHQASITRERVPALDALRAVPGLNITALFAPEHGLAGALQDQIAVQGARDKRTGLPVFSLYANPSVPAEAVRLAPSADMLKYVDALVFDLQDIGVRYYTFIWTMALAMEACARNGKSFIVLDRPNPLGGEKMEGNMPDPAFSSFVGLYPLPTRHALTAGELALYLNRKYGWNADLHVVKMKGWKRAWWFDQTGLPWVMPSPNMPSLDTAAVYAGLCLLEATNLSEGRGTTRPFEMMGAPYVDAHRLAGEMNKLKLPGAYFRPCAFLPTFHKWADIPCQGVHTHVTDRARFDSFLTGLTLIQTVRKLWPNNFHWKQPPYEFEARKRPMDILCGTDRVRRHIESGKPVKQLAAVWKKDCARFASGAAFARLY